MSSLADTGYVRTYIYARTSYILYKQGPVAGSGVYERRLNLVLPTTTDPKRSVKLVDYLFIYKIHVCIYKIHVCMFIHSMMCSKHIFINE